MKMFAFEPARYREEYAERGWVHIGHGVHPDFLAYLKEFTARRFQERRVEGKAIYGAKEQALFEFPEDTEFPGELFDAIATVAGLNRDTMTLSERHIKAYDPDAPVDPIPHKDRFASQVAVGLSIDIPRGSKLFMYPADELAVNPFNVSSDFLASLEPHQRPEIVLKDAACVEIEDEPGDVGIFRGSAVWHGRRNAANTTNLYLKMNDFNSDPLGEDPSTEERRRRTLELLESKTTAGAIPVLARRLDVLTRQINRGGEDVLLANVWDQSPVMLTSAEWEWLGRVDGRRRIAEVDGEIRMINRLASRGVIDLIQ